MNDLFEFTAVEVNGEAIDLHTVLVTAKFSGTLDIIEQVIDALLIRQAAAHHNIAITDDELQQAADEFRRKHELFRIEDLESWLKARRLTYEDWEWQLEDALLAHRWREALTRDKVAQYFAEHKLFFDAVTLSRLLVSDEDLARELRAQIAEEGADFHALARKHSLDTVTRPAGGYAGILKREDLEAVAESAIFGARAGEIVGPFKTSEGWCLFQVEELRPAALNEITREAIQSLLFSEWLNEQRRRARIVCPLLDEI